MRYDLHYTTVQSILYQVGYGESTQHMLPACVAEFIEHQQITGSDERGLAVGYFMRCHYGHHRYSFEEIEGMFDGLNWLRRQWPGNDEEKEKRYQQQRKVFLKKWYREWKATKKLLRGRAPLFFSIEKPVRSPIDMA